MMPIAMRESNSISNGDSGSSSSNSVGSQVVEWVYEKYYKKNHTNTTTNTTSTNTNKSKVHVHQSTMSPLYFQHEGHSRTIIGIEKKVRHNGTHEYSLLLFDPAVSPHAVHDALQKGKGWQYLIKRGVHTLKEKQFQLLYIDGHHHHSGGGGGSGSWKRIVAAERY